jgi:phage replication O-like protein O
MCANPQKENGFTPIANEIIEALSKSTLTAYEYKAILFILRNTYGFQRKEWIVKKWKEFEKIGISNSHVARTLSMLCERKIIEISDKKIIFNKDYEQWVKIDTSTYFKTDEKVTSSGKNNNEKLPHQVKNGTKKVTSSGKKNNEKLPHQVKNGTKKVTSSGKTFTSSGKNGFLDTAQNVAPQGVTSGTNLAKETLKKEGFFKENSSSSSYIDPVQGNEKGDDEDEFFLQKRKAEEILRKTLGNLYTQCVLLDEDLILIGKHEQERIERVAKRARRMIKNVKMIPEYILNGLLNYGSLYKEKKKRLDVPPGLAEHEKFKQEYETTDFEAGKKELGKIFSMLDEKEKEDGE